MNRIKELRIQRDIKQNELAAAINVSAPTLSGYETERYQAPIEVYKSIANFFHVSLDYLFGGPEDPRPVQVPAPFPAITEKFGRLDERDRIRVESYMDGLLAGEKYNTTSARIVG